MTTTIARDVRALLQTKEVMDFTTLFDEGLLSPEDMILAEHAPESPTMQTFPPSLPTPSIRGPGKGDELKEEMEEEEEMGGLVGGGGLFGKNNSVPATAAPAAATLQSTERMKI